MNQKNILGNSLEICSTNPMTGYHRDGYCTPNIDDHGKHYVCAKMDQNFLDFTASKGNDLSSVVKEGENWCLCEDRYEEALLNGKAPFVIKEATHFNTKSSVENKLIKEGFSTHNKTIDIGNLFFIVGTLFFIDICFLNAKYTKSLKKLNFLKKIIK